ncbi:peptidoglycan-binding protein [Actinomycetia phage DSL-LC01]|nr:peptidoglycan-binding protein [Actinomycetia phage DSL-LC01]
MTDINEHEEPALEPAAEAATEPALTETEIIAEAKPARKKSRPVAVADAVVGGGTTDDVYLDRCVFKNLYARKSLTVHHVQRRLNDLGYTAANDDKDGWYGDLTRDAVAAWQRDNGVEGDGTMDAKTFMGIFDGDPNVTPHV